MQIDYCFETQPLGNLEIEDIGNCYIEANTDLNEQFYFAARTRYGLTKICVFGPIDSANQELQTSYSCKTRKLDFNIAKIKKEIDTLLNNNPKFEITQAKIISEDEFKEAFINPLNIYFNEPEDIEEDFGE